MHKIPIRWLLICAVSLDRIPTGTGLITRQTANVTVLVRSLFLRKLDRGDPVRLAVSVTGSIIMHPMIAGLDGILYPMESEPAYSVARMWQAFGLTLGFIIVLLYTSLAAFLYLLLGMPG